MRRKTSINYYKKTKRICKGLHNYFWLYDVPKYIYTKELKKGNKRLRLKIKEQLKRYERMVKWGLPLKVQHQLLNSTSALRQKEC